MFRIKDLYTPADNINFYPLYSLQVDFNTVQSLLDSGWFSSIWKTIIRLIERLR
jgi:hypothetical protein